MTLLERFVLSVLIFLACSVLGCAAYFSYRAEERRDRQVDIAERLVDVIVEKLD